jgi:hypothetical protein
MLDYFLGVITGVIGVFIYSAIQNVRYTRRYTFKCDTCGYTKKCNGPRELRHTQEKHSKDEHMSPLWPGMWGKYVTPTPENIKEYDLVQRLGISEEEILADADTVIRYFIPLHTIGNYKP